MVYGSLDNPKLTYSKNVNLRAGVNKVSLLSVSVGLAVSKKKKTLLLFLLYLFTHGLKVELFVFVFPSEYW